MANIYLKTFKNWNSSSMFHKEDIMTWDQYSTLLYEWSTDEEANSGDQLKNIYFKIFYSRRVLHTMKF